MKPVVSPVPELKDLRPLELFLKIPKKTIGLVFLHSQEDGRWSLISAFPEQLVRYDGQHVFLNDTQQQQSLDEVMKNLLESRKQEQVENPSQIPFLGGFLGSLDYEYGLETLDLPTTTESHSLVQWGIYNHALLFDHHQHQWYSVCVQGSDGLPWQEWMNHKTENLNIETPQLKPEWNFSDYQQAFSKLHQNIIEGEVYQACLTFPFRGAASNSPRQLFAKMSQAHPSKMSVYLEQPERQILSFSPERFIEWQNGTLHTMPIKGTAPRGSNEEEDQKNKQQLLQNHKEAAELNMITDLLRNDLAMVSVPGTVQVREHRALQKLPAVWHSYSHIQSESKKDLNAWEILKTMFPGGSISGCPKRRAVQILTELEPSPRGIYTGCIGYISDHGRMDMNIAIRTIENTSTGMRAGFGGGIVYDSDIAAEYEECFAKSKKLVEIVLSD